MLCHYKLHHSLQKNENSSHTTNSLYILISSHLFTGRGNDERMEKMKTLRKFTLWQEEFQTANQEQGKYFKEFCKV